MHGSLSFLGWWTHDCRVWDTTFEGDEDLMILAACCRHQLHACFREFWREVSGDENMQVLFRGLS